MDALASATRDILMVKMDTILTLNVGKLQQLEYLTSSVHALYDFRDFVSRVGTASQMTAFDTALNNAVIYKGYDSQINVCLWRWCTAFHEHFLRSEHLCATDVALVERMV